MEIICIICIYHRAILVKGDGIGIGVTINYIFVVKVLLEDWWQVIGVGVEIELYFICLEDIFTKKDDNAPPTSMQPSSLMS